MKGRSILLPINGSQQSRYAADLCWMLADKLGCSVTAQHVVDSHSAWEFLGHEKPAFLDGERYLRAYQQLCASLFTLGEDLSSAYQSEALAKGHSPLCEIDEGNPIERVCERALAHDMVVIGHRALTETMRQNPRSQFLRISVAEALANDCARPVLIVQERVTGWDTLVIMVSGDHINELYINSCLAMARALNLNPLLLGLGGSADLTANNFVATLREANPALMNVPIGFTNELAEEVIGNSLLWNICLPDDVPELDGKMLFCLPTRGRGSERLTVLDSAATTFVRFLNLPAILLWPEEYTFSFEHRDAQELVGIES